jgi:hypothetical protein
MTGRRVLLAVLPAFGVAGVLGAFLQPQAAPPERFCPGGAAPDPRVVFCDNFENANAHRRWDVGSNRNIWPLADVVRCDDEGFGFQDRCAAWTNRLVFDHEWGFYGYDARHGFPAQSELYIRWYQAISDPYEWGTLEDKSVMVHDSQNTITAYVATSRDARPTVAASGPGMPFVANYQDLDWQETEGALTRVNRFQTERNPIVLLPGRWYLFEWYIKLNTPGTSNGITRLWIDEASRPIARQTLRLQHTDMRWLRREDAGKAIGVLRLTVYHQRCDNGPRNTCPPNGPAVLDQFQQWDQIVVSTAPIGPAAPRDRARASEDAGGDGAQR